MSDFQSLLNRCGLIIVLFTTFFLTVSAQSTIYNVPSTDIVAKKTFYAEADYITHFGSFRKGGFRSGGYRLVYGARKNVEVGLNVFHTQSEGLSQTELQPNIKWRFYRNEKRGVASTAGAIVFVPLNKQTGNRPATLLYSNISKGFNFARGVRLTAGAYKVLNVERKFGTKAGAIIGIEKTITRKLTFVTDWYSGKNRLGYSAAGFGYAITKKQFIFTGYNFGNSGRANNAFSAFYGFTF